MPKHATGVDTTAKLFVGKRVKITAVNLNDFIIPP